ncbi:MAG: helix-turn-helix transcriptional regulator [Planctomycetes bacterium]|nr:helix-turn-helix transcriptional regulator [Planctomycetota bacterium]
MTVTPTKYDTDSDLLTYRYRRNLTLVQLSALTGLSPSTLHRLERGVLKASPRSLVKLMDGLKLDAQQLEHMLQLSVEKYGKPARRLAATGRLTSSGR